jgi:hypothetical protein
MPIIRLAKRDSYKIISTATLSDARMSWKARGLLCYLLGRPDDWSVSVEQLANHGPDGVSATRSAIAELVELGYMVRQDVRNPDGTMARRDYIVREHPQCDYPHVDYPHVDNRTLSIKEYKVIGNLPTAADARETEPAFILPPDITGKREDWMPHIQGWILQLFEREGVSCSIGDSAKIVERVAISKLQGEQLIRYLTEDVAAKCERAKSAKGNVSSLVRYIGSASDIERWLANQKQKEVEPETKKRHRVKTDRTKTPMWIKTKEMAEAYGYAWDRAEEGR